MFEREINFIYDFNANKVRKAGSYISFEQLKNSGIHPSIFQYIVGEIDFLIYEDRQKLLINSAFDYTIPNVANYLNLIAEEVKRSKRFSINYIDKIIKHSSSFIVNYLCKPNWTLQRFVFDDRNEKSTSEIEQILSYTYYYPHLKKIISAYFRKKKIISFTASEFQALLVKIDLAGLETNYNKIIDEFIDSLSDFFNIGVSKTTHIPLKAVEYFLLDKNLHNHSKLLDDNFSPDANQKVNASEVKEFLKRLLFEKTEYLEEDAFIKNDENSRVEFDKINENENVEVEHPIIESKIEKKDKIPEEVALPETDPDLQSDASVGIPNDDYDVNSKANELSENESTSTNGNELDEVNNDDLIEENIIESNDNENELSLFESESYNESSNKENLDENNPSETKGTLDISEILNDKSMSKILDVVFDYDVEDFSSAVEKIIKSDSLDEAFLRINVICEAAKLEPDSKESKTFKKVISKYFK